ncbi:MAG: aminoacyl-tRNA hydrolase [Planctomycetaceae bacterium]|nr:aminoacyl-tRNA hydrolase [Planctomycetaceae bacterium]
MLNKIQILENELEFQTSRSSGPGGQNVNKLNTKVAVIINIPTCSFLTDAQKEIILKKLSSRLTKDNRLIVESQRFRTQRANRDFAIEKLTDVIEAALRVPKKRKPTKPTYSAVQKRLKHKKMRSDIKKHREKNFTSE